MNGVNCIFESFIKITTCLGLSQATIIIIGIWVGIESCACSYPIIYMIILISFNGLYYANMHYYFISF